jgi:class 3 adenylate cyclase
LDLAVRSKNRCFEKPAVTHKIIEILGNNFSYEEIIVIGQRNEDDFNIHIPDNHYGRLRLQPHIAAEYLATHFRDNGRLEDIVKFLLYLDCGSLNGRDVCLSEMEDLLITLRRSGVGYDFGTREFFSLEENDNHQWENCLKEKKEYEFSFVSVDTVDSSQLSVEEQRPKLDQTYDSLQHLITTTALKYDGSLWSWQGDGGLLAFWGKSHRTSALFFCFEILGFLPVFNLKDSRIGRDINLRFGIDSGTAVYKNEKGSILSKAINFAAHLEKKCTDRNSITISSSVYSVLNKKQKEYFGKRDNLEGNGCYTLIKDMYSGAEDQSPEKNGRMKKRERNGNSLKGILLNR